MAERNNYRYVLMIDDDVGIPEDMPIPLDLFDQPNVKCVGYTIKSIDENGDPGTIVQQIQDFEYKMAGLFFKRSLGALYSPTAQSLYGIQKLLLNCAIFILDIPYLKIGISDMSPEKGAIVSHFAARCLFPRLHHRISCLEEMPEEAMEKCLSCSNAVTDGIFCCRNVLSIISTTYF